MANRSVSLEDLELEKEVVPCRVWHRAVLHSSPAHCYHARRKTLDYSLVCTSCRAHLLCKAQQWSCGTWGEQASWALEHRPPETTKKTACPQGSTGVDQVGWHHRTHLMSAKTNLCGSIFLTTGCSPAARPPAWLGSELHHMLSCPAASCKAVGFQVQDRCICVSWSGQCFPGLLFRWNK